MCIQDTFRNRKLIIFTIFITLLAFGFTITNFSIGLDDPAANHYLSLDEYGNMIQQGRLLHVFYAKLTGAFQFIPFFNDFVGAVLFMLSALMFCALFQYITESAFSSVELALFTGIYLSYPIISEKFIYNLDVVVTMSSYLFTVFSLLTSYDFIKYKRKKSLILALISLFLAVGSYESFCFLYICGVFSIFICECIIKREKITIKRILGEGLGYAFILFLAVLGYYFLVFIVQKNTNQLNIFTRNSVWNADSLFIDKIKEIVSKFIYSLKSIDYFPMLEVVVFSVIGFGVSLIESFKRKSMALFLCFVGLFISNFGIHMAVGFIMYRAGQTFCFSIAFIVLLLIYLSRNMNIMRNMCVLVSCILIYGQCANLNLSFYHDYARYKKEEFAVNTIATRLVAECDVNKPVVFVKDKTLGYLQSPIEGQVNGNSFMYWGVKTFGKSTSPILINIFKMHGYYFLKEPTSEQAELGNKLAEQMTVWPSKNGIKEFEDIIVIKIG